LGEFPPTRGKSSKLGCIYWREMLDAQAHGSHSTIQLVSIQNSTRQPRKKKTSTQKMPKAYYALLLASGLA